MGFFIEEEYTFVTLPVGVFNKHYSAICDWLLTLPDDDYEWSKQHLIGNQQERGFWFRHDEDIITFKLKFGT